jgi:hypothetical protein
LFPCPKSMLFLQVPLMRLAELSLRKRVFPEEKFWPPQLSVSLWTPLLKHIQVLHASFACTLCAHILCHLLPPDATAHHTSQSMVENRKDPSSDMCLARWIMWCLDTWSNSSSVSQEETNAELRKDVIISLMQGLGYRMSDHRSKDTEACVQSSHVSPHPLILPSTARTLFFKPYAHGTWNTLRSQTFSQSHLIISNHRYIHDNRS